jgi:hypothetical protein
MMMVGFRSLLFAVATVAGEEASYALTGKVMDMSADGTLTVPIGSEEWLYVWLRPR